MPDATHGPRQAAVLAAAEKLLGEISISIGGPLGAAQLDQSVRAPPLARATLGRRLVQMLRQPAGTAAVLSIGGYSVTAGHGVYYNESWPEVLQRLLQPLFSAAGVPLDVRNMGNGGIASLPYGWCASYRACDTHM